MKKDWEIKKLGEIYNFIDYRGMTPNKIEKGIPLITAKNVRMGYIDYSIKDYISEEDYKKRQTRGIAHKGDILFTTEAPLGFSAIADLETFSTGQRIITFQQFENEKNLFNPFFNYYFQSNEFQKTLKENATGLTATGIKASRLKELKIPVPPLEEQKRIVKILDEKFAQLETIKANAQTNLQNAKDLFQSQLTKAFSNTTWEKKTIGEVCSKRENIKWKNENANTEYQYIDLSAVDRESKNISDTQIITKENAPSRAQQIVKTGDILFGTTRPTLKRFCLLSGDYDGQICSTGFCVIRPNQNIVSPDWMFYQFYNDEFYKYIEPLQKGANYPAVTDKDILNYNISVPPLPEQKCIVEELDTLSEKVRQLQEIYTKQIANCEELKQSLLQKVFEGEL